MNEITITEFKEDFSGVCRQADEEGAVIITRRQTPTWVLMTIEEYNKLIGDKDNG